MVRRRCDDRDRHVALIGFSLIATAAGSIENRARNLPLSMIVAVALPTIPYVLVMLVAAVSSANTSIRSGGPGQLLGERGSGALRLVPRDARSFRMAVPHDRRDPRSA